MTEIKLSWLLYVPPLLAVGSAFLLLSTGLEGIWMLLQALRQRLVLWDALSPVRPKYRVTTGRFQRRSILDIIEKRSTVERDTSWSMPAPPKTFWWGLGGGAALAALWHHPLLSPWFVALGGVGGWTLSIASPVMTRRELYVLESFISSFRHQFTVTRSVFNTLQAAAQDLDEESPLREAVERAAQKYHADADVEAALSTLRELDWPHLSRLADMLAQIGKSDIEMVEEALENLEEQTRRSRRLRDRAKTVLTLNRITLRVLQAANVTALVAGSLVSLWRGYYVQHPLMLMVLTIMMVGGSWYFSHAVSQIGRIS